MASWNATIDYQRATLLRSQGLTYKEIAATLGVNWESLKAGMVRKRLTRLVRSTRQSVIAKAESTADAVLKRTSEHTRVSVAESVARDVTFLATSAPTIDQEQLKERYEAIEPAVRVASKVFGWGEESVPARSVSLTNITVHNRGRGRDADSGATPQQLTVDVDADATSTPAATPTTPGASQTLTSDPTSQLASTSTSVGTSTPTPTPPPPARRVIDVRDHNA